MSTVSTVRRPGSFRYEADLVDVLETRFAASMFRADSAVHTFREVPAARGIPDLTAVRFDLDRVLARQAAGIRPLSTDTEVHIVLALQRSSLNFADLATVSGMTRDYVRRAVLPLLEQQGWVEITARGTVRLREHAMPVGRRVVTVEAKLKDWTRAFGQARNQLRSADAAYIALDASRAAAALEEHQEIAARGIGVLTVDAQTNTHKVVARPKPVLLPRQTVVGRTLIAERCLALMLEGRTSGQVAPVFGWTRPDG